MKKSEHYRELDSFSAIACLLVVLIHVLSLGITDLRPDSWQMAAVFFPWKLSGFVVPAFLFCSALKVGRLAEQENFRYFPYLFGRIRRIYLPYLIANAVYYAVFGLISYIGPPSPLDFIRYVLTGTLSSPFYYIVIIMQFYLLVPLWLRLVQRVPWYSALFFALLFTILASKTEALFALCGIAFPYADRVFTTYLWFLTAGLYAGRFYEPLRSRLRSVSPLVFLTAAVPLLFVFLAYLGFTRQFYLYDLNLLKLFSDTVSIILLWKTGLVIADHARKAETLLAHIHDASFFVYLYHCLFLVLGTVVSGHLGIRDIGLLLLIRAAVCYLCPFGLSFAYRAIVSAWHRHTEKRRTA